MENSKRVNHRWTTKELAKIREMMAEGKTCKAIAEKLNLPYTKVQNQIRHIREEDNPKETLQEKLERIAPEQSEYPEMTAENGIDDYYDPTIEAGGGIKNRNFDTDTKCADLPIKALTFTTLTFTDEEILKCAKYCISADTCNKCNSCKLGNSNIECYDLLSDLLVRTAEKEPASAGTPTSSNEIKSTDSITLSEQNVNLAVEMLRLASDTLDQIYKSDDFNSLNTGLAVGFGRAWAVIDMAVDMLNMEGK